MTDNYLAAAREVVDCADDGILEDFDARLILTATEKVQGKSCMRSKSAA